MVLRLRGNGHPDYDKRADPYVTVTRARVLVASAADYLDAKAHNHPIEMDYARMHAEGVGLPPGGATPARPTHDELATHELTGGGGGSSLMPSEAFCVRW